MIPHMGWNVVEAAPGSRLFKGLAPDTRFYFVHSYAAQTWEGDPALLTWATHHARFPCRRGGTGRCRPRNFIRRRAATRVRALANWH